MVPCTRWMPTTRKKKKKRHQQDMQSRGAVMYSSQWVGWVPGDWCGGDSDLGASAYEVKNLKITARVVQGPEPRRCSAVLAPSAVAMV